MFRTLSIDFMESDLSNKSIEYSDFMALLIQVSVDFTSQNDYKIPCIHSPRCLTKS